MKTMQSTKKMTLKLYPAENGGAVRYDDGTLYVKEGDEFDSYVGRMVLCELEDEHATEVEISITYKMQVPKGGEQ